MADLTATTTQIAQAALANSSGVLASITSSGGAIAKNIVLCNTDSSAHTVFLNFINSGDTAEVANSVLSGLSLAPKETKVIYLSTVLPVSSTIEGYADTASVVSINISGVTVA